MTQVPSLSDPAKRYSNYVIPTIAAAIAFIFPYNSSIAERGENAEKLKDLQAQITVNKAEYTSRLDTLEHSIESVNSQNTLNYGAIKEVAGKVDLLSKQMTYAK